MRFQSNLVKLAVIGVISLTATGAFAMGPDGGEHHHPGEHECGCMRKHEGHKGMMKSNRIPWVLKEKLGLTGKQAGEIYDIMQEEMHTAKPLFESLHKERKALMVTAMAGDQAAIKAQSGKLADAITAMAMHHAKVHKRIASVMTREQAAKFDKFAAEFMEHKGEHGMMHCDRGHGMGGPMRMEHQRDDEM